MGSVRSPAQLQINIPAHTKQADMLIWGPGVSAGAFSHADFVKDLPELSGADVSAVHRSTAVAGVGVQQLALSVPFAASQR